MGLQGVLFADRINRRVNTLLGLVDCLQAHKILFETEELR
jgi:hypothetical protein